MSKEVVVYPDVEPEGDKIYRLAEAALSLIPAGQPILHSLISPPVQTRMEKWVSSVEARLLELEREKKISFNELVTRSDFSALALRCIQAAAITSKEDMLIVFKNFIVNAALLPNADEDEVLIMQSMLSDFTPSHIKVLHLYSQPELYLSKLLELGSSAPPTNGKQGRELHHCFRNGSPEFWQNVYLSLSGKHLVVANVQLVKSTLHHYELSSRLTPIGNKLISLITE